MPEENPLVFVPFKLAQPRRGVRSIWDALRGRVPSKPKPQTNCCFDMLNGGEQSVFVQQKFDGHRQLVSFRRAGGKLTVHNKEDTDTSFVNAEALGDIQQALASLIDDSAEFEGFVLDTELVALDERGNEDLYSVAKVKKAHMGPREGARPNFELVVFDISRRDLDQAPYRSRYDYLTRFLTHSGRHAKPGADAVAGPAQPRVERNRVCLVRNLAEWTKSTTPEECAALGANAVDSHMEGLVFRGTRAPFASRRPGSSRRKHASVGMKVKPEHLVGFGDGIATLLACGVSRSFQLIVAAPTGAPPSTTEGHLFGGVKLRFVGKAQPVESTPAVPPIWFGDRSCVQPFTHGADRGVVYPPNRPHGWTEFGSKNGKQEAQVWFDPPFAVRVKCDYRLSSINLLQYAFATGAVPSGVDPFTMCSTDATLRDDMVRRARALFQQLAVSPPLVITRQLTVEQTRAKKAYRGHSMPYPPLEGTYKEWVKFKGAGLDTRMQQRKNELNDWQNAVVRDGQMDKQFIVSAKNVDEKTLQLVQSRKQPWDERPATYSRMAIEVAPDALARGETAGSVKALILRHGGVSWERARHGERRVRICRDDQPDGDAAVVSRPREWFDKWLESDEVPLMAAAPAQ